MTPEVYVVGVGMTKFTSCATKVQPNYVDLVKEAVTNALNDANLMYSDIQQATVGYVYGDSTSGQNCLYELGMTGIPILNVNNNCATGATALHVLKSFVQAGIVDCGLAVGFEVMGRHFSDTKYPDIAAPLENHISELSEKHGVFAAPIVPQLFARAGEEHMRMFGTKVEHYEKISWKNHLHSKNNPFAQEQREYCVDEIRNSKKVFSFLTKPHCCPTSNGSAAVILASKRFVKRHSLEKNAVKIASMVMQTDFKSTFNEGSSLKLVGYDMTRLAAQRAFHEASLGPQDVNVIELHDCFSVNELITYEALGLCGIGEAKHLIDSGNNTYGGQYVVNPSGGLLSKGHPLGATGVAQCTELNWQLRGIAGERQVHQAKIALQHNLGLGGATVVAIYQLGFPSDK